jgi:hypothetical protein
MGHDLTPRQRHAEDIPGPLATTKIALKPPVIGAASGRTECTGAPCFVTHAPLMTKLSSGVDHVNLIFVHSSLRLALLVFSSIFFPALCSLYQGSLAHY